MYIMLKYIHVLTAIIMIGTTVVNGLIELRTFWRKDSEFSAFSLEIVMLLNNILMLPSLIILPLSGLLLALYVGYPLHSPWLLYSMILAVALLIAFVIGYGMEKRMAQLARKSTEHGEPLNSNYYKVFHRAKWVGMFASIASLTVLYMMIAKRLPFM